MAQKKKRSRLWMTIGASLLIVAGLTFAFWPRATMVDIGLVERAPMTVTIDEEGRTRVRDAYVVSTPFTGRLLRVEVEPGDAVESGKTVIAKMLPANPEALDARSRERARADVASAEGALRVARAAMNKAVAEKDLAAGDLKRARELRSRGTTSQAALDRAEQAARAAEAALDSARADISMRIAGLDSARAQLISFNDRKLGVGEPPQATDTTTVTAPVSGRILRVMQVSETTLPAGTPILEIGNTSSDLEVVTELLSTDAVQIATGDRVIIDNWGGQNPLHGVVERIEPWGFTKVSALGVEEQRVNAIIRFTDASQDRRRLGHGFRVEVRIVVWEDENALVAPSSALFRDGDNWSVFVVNDGEAKSQRVKIGRNNGTQAEIEDGLKEGDAVVLYPASGLADGTRVAQRSIE